MRGQSYMSPAQAWKRLGLEPCSDERAVKRAYAAKLKSIDPDKDIEGFGKLRQALEVARNEARWRKEDEERGVDPDQPLADEDHVADVDYADDYGGVDYYEDSLPAPQPPRANPEVEGEPIEELEEPEPSEPDPINAHFRDLQDALFRQDFTSEDDRKACDALDAILSDERISQVGFSEDVEGWLAQIFDRSIPNSDSAIMRADRHFGWRQEIERANPRWQIQFVARRAADLECMDVLQNTDHRWHEAYVALRKGSPDNYSFSERMRLQPLIADLISSLRHHNPAVEHEFNPDVVDAWIEAGSSGPARELIQSEGISWFGWLVLLTLFWQLGRAALGAIS